MWMLALLALIVVVSFVVACVIAEFAFTLTFSAQEIEGIADTPNMPTLEDIANVMSQENAEEFDCRGLAHIWEHVGDNMVCVHTSDTGQRMAVADTEWIITERAALVVYRAHERRKRVPVRHRPVSERQPRTRRLTAITRRVAFA